MKFKCRASAAGTLMTNSRSKSQELSKTTLAYLDEWIKEQIYGVKKDISNKYITKGNMAEDDSINLLGDYINDPFLLKNETHYDSEWFTGTPDVITSDRIYDVKTSWDCFTFPLFANEIPNKDYYYQLQVYMHLLEIKNASLVYCLVNTPEPLRYTDTDYADYSTLPIEYRVKKFDIEYDINVIEDLQKRVMACRKYVNELVNTNNFIHILS